MESKVIQQFLGEIDGVKFDKENVYYSSEHILSKIEGGRKSLRKILLLF